MPLTQEIERESMMNGAMYRTPVTFTAGATYFKGALINVLQTSGKGKKSEDAADEVFSGYLEETVDATAEDTVGTVIKDDKVWIPYETAALTDLENFFYATDDDTIATASTNVGPCGQCVDVRVGEALLIDFSKKLPKSAMS